MVIDCTGHGVLGAFVSMLVKAIERQVNWLRKQDLNSAGDTEWSSTDNFLSLSIFIPNINLY